MTYDQAITSLESAQSLEQVQAVLTENLTPAPDGYGDQVEWWRAPRFGGEAPRQAKQIDDVFVTWDEQRVLCYFDSPSRYRIIPRDQIDSLDLMRGVA